MPFSWFDISSAVFFLANVNADKKKKKKMLGVCSSSPLFTLQSFFIYFFFSVSAYWMASFTFEDTIEDNEKEVLSSN